MATWEITCINKSDRFNPHERIKFVGGREGGGWRLSVTEVIDHIQKQGNSFFVNVRGQIAYVEVAYHNGHAYIKTRADGIEPNNLLALPECPA